MSRKFSSVSLETEVVGSLTTSATSITVVSATNLLGGINPADISASNDFIVVLDPETSSEEIVKVTAVASNTLTVTRGHDGSTAKTHTSGAKVRHMAIGEDLRNSATHIDATAAHGATGAVVGTTNTQTLTNKTIDAASNTISNIANANVASAAAIADTKLATISTAGKVQNTATTATSSNSGSAIVSRDASGNFSAGTITASLTGNVTGNASTATTLATGRDFQITGDVEASAVSFNGSGNVTLNTQIATGSIVNADINASAAIDKTKISGTAITAADTGTVTNTMLAGSIANTKLATNPLDRANHTGTQIAGTISDFNDTVTSFGLDEFQPPLSAVDMDTQRIINLGSPNFDTDAATKGYVDQVVTDLVDGAPGTLDTLNEIAAAIADTANFSDTVVLKSGSTMSGNLAMGTNKITGMGDPTSAQDAATKNYVDTAVIAPTNLTGVITSVGNVTSIASQTGTGTKFVVDDSPTLISPDIGAAIATSINGTLIPSETTLIDIDSTQYLVPSQTGQSGKYLTTDGTTASWDTVSSGSATYYQTSAPTATAVGELWVDSDATASVLNTNDFVQKTNIYSEAIHPFMLMGA